MGNGNKTAPFWVGKLLDRTVPRKRWGRGVTGIRKEPLCLHTASDPRPSGAARPETRRCPTSREQTHPTPAGCRHRLGCRRCRCPALWAGCSSSEIRGEHPPAGLQTRAHLGEHGHGAAHGAICSRVGTRGSGAPHRGQRGGLSFSLLPTNSFFSSPSADPTFSVPAGSLETASAGLFSQRSCPAQTREV